MNDEGVASFTLTEDINPPTAGQYGIILECPTCEKQMDFQEDDARWFCGGCGESVALADLNETQDAPREGY